MQPIKRQGGIPVVATTFSASRYGKNLIPTKEILDNIKSIDSFAKEIENEYQKELKYFTGAELRAFYFQRRAFEANKRSIQTRKGISQGTSFVGQVQAHQTSSLTPSETGEDTNAGSQSPGQSTAKFQFTSYQDGREWIDRESKKYPSRNAFYATNKYKQAYPLLKKLWDDEQKLTASESDKVMSDAGVKYGDRVYYDYVTPFMAGENYSGTLVNRNGIPYVKLDDGQTTISGQKSVRWHKGWKKEQPRSRFQLNPQSKQQVQNDNFDGVFPPGPKGAIIAGDRWCPDPRCA